MNPFISNFKDKVSFIFNHLECWDVLHFAACKRWSVSTDHFQGGVVVALYLDAVVLHCPVVEFTLSLLDFKLFFQALKLHLVLHVHLSILFCSRHLHSWTVKYGLCHIWIFIHHKLSRRLSHIETAQSEISSRFVLSDSCCVQFIRQLGALLVTDTF